MREEAAAIPQAPYARKEKVAWRLIHSGRGVAGGWSKAGASDTAPSRKSSGERKAVRKRSFGTKSAKSEARESVQPMNIPASKRFCIGQEFREKPRNRMEMVWRVKARTGKSPQGKIFSRKPLFQSRTE